MVLRLLTHLICAILMAGCLEIEAEPDIGGPQTPPDMLDVELFTEETGEDGPAGPSPADDATGVSVDRLSWHWGDGQAGALVFDVYLEAGDDSPDRLVCSGLVTAACELPEELASETTYYWQVTAVDAEGLPSYGPVWRFDTAPKATSALFGDDFAGEGARDEHYAITFRDGLAEESGG